MGAAVGTRHRGPALYTPAVGEFLKNTVTVLAYMAVIAAVTTGPLVAWLVWVWVFRDRRS